LHPDNNGTEFNAMERNTMTTTKDNLADKIAERRRAVRGRRKGDINTPRDVSINAADELRENLPDNVAAVLDYFIDKADAHKAAQDARYHQSQKLRDIAAEADRKAALARQGFEEAEKRHQTPVALKRVERLEVTAAKAKARIAELKSTPLPVNAPAFHPTRFVQFVVQNARRPQREVIPAIPAKLRKYDSDPAKGLPVVRAEIERLESELDAVCDALAPHEEGVDRFNAALAHKRSKFNWNRLLRIEHGKDARIIEQVPEVPDSVIFEALHPFIVSHCKRELDESVKRGKAQGYGFLSRGERTKRIRALTAEIEALEQVEGYWLRQLIVDGVEVTIRPDMSTAALVGIERDPAVPDAEPLTVFDIPGDRAPHIMDTPLNR
jgi:uncharacterized small protein (DUF1192 family)